MWTLDTYRFVAVLVLWSSALQSSAGVYGATREDLCDAVDFVKDDYNAEIPEGLKGLCPNVDEDDSESHDDEAREMEDENYDEMADRKCRDKKRHCSHWSRRGFCSVRKYRSYMWRFCCRSCTAVDVKTINSAQCGVTNVKRVAGGTEANANTYPWVAMVATKERSDRIHCGGSLITSRWIVSAAHCFLNQNSDDPNDYVVKLGIHNLNEGSAKTIDRIILHIGFNSATYGNDIALLRLSKPVKLTRKIRPVCLPTITQGYHVGDVCTIAGWGRPGTDLRHLTVLHHAQVPLVSIATCYRSYAAKQYAVTTNMICAGHTTGNIDACQGDSGGPLTCLKNSRHVLSGIISWGVGCGDPRYYGVYTNVAKYIDWIQDRAV